MRTSAADLLLSHSILAEFSADMYSRSQPLSCNPDPLYAVKNLFATDACGYTPPGSNHHPLVQNVHPAGTRTPATADGSKEMWLPATRPAGPAPQLTDRIPTYFGTSNPFITSASSPSNGSPYAVSYVDTSNSFQLQYKVVNDMSPIVIPPAKTEKDSKFAVPQVGGFVTGHADSISANLETQIPMTVSSRSEDSTFPVHHTVIALNQFHSPLPVACPIPSPHQQVTKSPCFSGLLSPDAYGSNYHISRLGSSALFPHFP